MQPSRGRWNPVHDVYMTCLTGISRAALPVIVLNESAGGKHSGDARYGNEQSVHAVGWYGTLTSLRALERSDDFILTATGVRPTGHLFQTSAKAKRSLARATCSRPFQGATESYEKDMPRPSYGAARDSDVYVARDQDWHDFAEKEHSLANNDGNGGPNNVEYGEYEYDEDYYYYEEQADDSVAAVPVSDVAHSVYYDDMALTNVWLAALHDYKVQYCPSSWLLLADLCASSLKFDHPSQFAPQREAPRSAVVKCRLAPL